MVITSNSSATFLSLGIRTQVLAKRFAFIPIFEGLASDFVRDLVVNGPTILLLDCSRARENRRRWRRLSGFGDDGQALAKGGTPAHLSGLNPQSEPANASGVPAMISHAFRGSSRQC